MLSGNCILCKINRTSNHSEYCDRTDFSAATITVIFSFIMDTNDGSDEDRKEGYTRLLNLAASLSEHIGFAVVLQFLHLNGLFSV